MSQIQISEKNWNSISSYLIDPHISEERAIFGFVQCVAPRNFVLLDWVKMEGELVDVAHTYHIALSDIARQQIIKRAHDSNLALIEFHSHPKSHFAQFSLSDLAGFEEWVPHVMWRLPERPYFAVVRAIENFDALYWETRGFPANSDIEFIVGDSTKLPTGYTMKSFGNNE